MALAASAAAEASPCDDFKAVLAARIEATGVRGYSLELVAAADPVPRGAKVIATCESGTRKFLYRRWGAAGAAASSAADAAPSASPAPLPTAADAPSRRAPITRDERASTTLPPAKPATPVLVGPPGPRSGEAAAAVAATAAAPGKLLASSGVVAAPAIDRDVVMPPSLAQAETAADAATTLTQRAPHFVAAHWRWLAALALVAVVGGFWIWRVPFGAYDKDGLPRGPRL